MIRVYLRDGSVFDVAQNQRSLSDMTVLLQQLFESNFVRCEETVE